MRFFLNNHPYLSVIMLGMVCVTIVKTTYIIATDGDVKMPSLFKSKKEEDLEETEEVEEEE